MEKLSPAAGFLDLAARVIVVLEAVLMVVLAGAYGYYAVLDPQLGRFLWGAAVVCALFALGMSLVAWGFNKGKRFALGAAFAFQLLQVSAGVWLLGTYPAWGIPLLVCAAIVALAVMRRVARLPRESDPDVQLDA